jgi:methylase of polypeptide subunit release factors
MMEQADVVTKAIERLRSLPRAQAEAAASLLLAEIEAESAWDDLFARSQDELAALADEALAQAAAGRVSARDPADLFRPPSSA